MLQVMGQYDAPAYVRRARRVQAAYDTLMARCWSQREAWLAMVRLRVGVVAALAGGWETLRPHLAEAELRLVEGLHAQLRPKLRAPLTPTRSAWALRRALHELCDSLERFNHRWRAFLDKL